MRSLKKRIKEIEKIIKQSDVDTDDMAAWLREIIPGNKKTLAEILAELDTDTLRAISGSDEPGEVLAAAVRGKRGC